MKITVAFGLFFLLICFTACLKNEDNIPEGPKAQLSLVHVSFNTPALDLTVDKSKLTATPISFGTASASATNTYLPVEAGLRQLILASSSTTLLDKNFAFDASKFYSMFVFDTMKNNVLNTQIIIDDTTTIDTLGKARFFHFIPGKDLLSALLIKKAGTSDTTVLVTDAVYLSGSTSFPVNIKPGSYRLELKMNGSIIYSDTPVVIQARKLYSFIAKGTSGGTNTNAPSILTLHNN